MKRKILFMIIVIVILCFTDRVMASSYYTNQNGVTLTMEEYNFLSNMYWDGCQKNMSKDDYIRFKKSKMMDGEIEIVEKTFYEPTLQVLPFSDEIMDAQRTLKISKSCLTNCLISVTLKWTKSPTIRSYDVMGAYLYNTSLESETSTMVASDTTSKLVDDTRVEKNGIGASFLLPSGPNVRIIQTYEVSKGGHIYASYQHAMRESTLAKSKDYTFSRTGYGSVFVFSSISRPIYDGMNGVDIEV